MNKKRFRLKSTAQQGFHVRPHMGSNRSNSTPYRRGNFLRPHICDFSPPQADFFQTMRPTQTHLPNANTICYQSHCTFFRSTQALSQCKHDCYQSHCSSVQHKHPYPMQTRLLSVPLAVPPFNTLTQQQASARKSDTPKATFFRPHI